MTDASDAALLLEVRDLSIWYQTPRGTVRAADGVSLSVGSGKVLGLVGESGSGKSQTARAILGLIAPPGKVRPESSIRFGGRELVGLPERALNEVRGAQIAMIYQHPRSTLTPVYTVGDQIAEAIIAHEAVSWAAARKRALELLEAVRVPDPLRRARQYPHELSGGLCQRVAIAAALSCRPKLLIADEPTTALDVTTQAEILDLLQNLVAELGMAILFISHDLAVVRQIADDISVMYAGRIVETLPAKGLDRGARHPYTQALLRTALLTPDRDGRLPTIPGGVPDLIGAEPGCRFAPRCALRFGKCAETPPLTALASDQAVACWAALDKEAQPKFGVKSSV